MITLPYNNFYDCDNLTSVTFGKNLKTIGSQTCENCDSLVEIDIPDGVTSIGDSAFGYCSSLTSITIPDSVNSIEERAFTSCDNLFEFYGKFATPDHRCLIVEDRLVAFAPAGLTEYTITEPVKIIGSCTFSGTLIEEIGIPDSVTTIDDFAFSDCSLKALTIPHLISRIGRDAFINVGFEVCYCHPTTPPTLIIMQYTNGESWPFGYPGNIKCFYVPAESVEAYKAAEGWSEYTDYIVGYEF